MYLMYDVGFKIKHCLHILFSFVIYIEEPNFLLQHGIVHVTLQKCVQDKGIHWTIVDLNIGTTITRMN